MLLAISVLTVTFTGLGVMLYYSQKTDVVDRADECMRSQLDDLDHILSVMIKEKQNKTNSSLKVAHKLFYETGDVKENETITVNAVNQVTKERVSADINNWTLNGKTVYQNYTFVDEIQNLTGETATIFQKIGQGYLRISTNVKKLDGSRAVGTYIPNSSPVIQTIEKGETFRGRAFVVNDWYLTAYEPIYVNGEIKGILYVGVKEKDYAVLKAIFKDKSYYNSGYPFMVSNDGEFMIHPSLEGQNTSDKVFFKQLINSSGEGKARYEWPETGDRKWKWQYFKYFAPYQAYVCVSIYEDDLFSSVYMLRRFLFVAVIVAIVLAIICFAFFLQPLTRSVKDGINKAQLIADGDLNQEFDLSRTDEIGDLFVALKNMTAKIKEVIHAIKQSADEVGYASSQIHAGSVSLSQMSSEQASVSEEVASSIEQISANINQASLNASQTQEMSEKTFQSVKEGAESSNVSLVAMRKIAEKVRIIDDIAFQTNILALNASVEAARAGTFGAGFSIVATEVRKLAKQSKDAADDINGLTAEGLSLSERTGKQLADNVPESEKTARLILQITETAHEQSLGASQVSNAIHQLNDAIQHNAATSEELSSNADKLKELSAHLKEAIAYFNV